MRRNEWDTALALLIGNFINFPEFPVAIQNDHIANGRRLIHWRWKGYLLGKFAQFFQKHPYSSFLIQCFRHTQHSSVKPSMKEAGLTSATTIMLVVQVKE